MQICGVRYAVFCINVGVTLNPLNKGVATIVLKDVVVGINVYWSAEEEVVMLLTGTPLTVQV